MNVGNEAGNSYKLGESREMVRQVSLVTCKREDGDDRNLQKTECRLGLIDHQIESAASSLSGTRGTVGNNPNTC